MKERGTRKPMNSGVKAMLTENERRRKLLFPLHYDQLSGKGVPEHDKKVVIEGYPIRTQYLTEEVCSNPLYKMAIHCGSIEKLTNEIFRKLSIEVTEEEVIQALTMKRLERDPSFAFRVCYMITDKKSGQLVPFILNYAQRIMLSELEKMRRAGVPIMLVLLKARQWGGSTLAQLYMSWIQLFVRDGWNSIILAQTKDTARRIKGMYTNVLEHFPSFVFGKEELKFGAFERSASDSIVTDGKHNPIKRSVITIASYENYESARGSNLAMAHFSEVAYWRSTPSKSADALLTNIDGGMLKVPLTVQIIESTARGNSGYFYDEYQMAKDNHSNRKALFIPFFFIENDMLDFRTAAEKRAFADWLIGNKDNHQAPDAAHDSGAYNYSLWEKGATLEHIKWYVMKRAGLHSHEAMASEAPSDDIECFTFSGNKVFSSVFIEEQRKANTRVPLFMGDIHEDEDGKIKLVDLTSESGGLLKIWHHPDSLNTTDQYIVSVDVGGRSEKADYSVITVINRFGLLTDEPYLEVVARWRGHLRYDLMAEKAVSIAKYYKNALVVFESNTFDKKAAEAKDYTEQGDHIRGILNKIEDKYDNLYTRPATSPEDIREGIDRKIGFQTNRKTKQDMVDNFIVVFEDNAFIDHDKEFYKEIAIYEQRPDGSYGNIVGRDNHDDVLMTDMIGALVSRKMPEPRLIQKQEHSGYIDYGPKNESMI